MEFFSFFLEFFLFWWCHAFLNPYNAPNMYPFVLIWEQLSGGVHAASSIFVSLAGWATLIDVKSLICWHLAQEFLGCQNSMTRAVNWLLLSFLHMKLYNLSR